MILLPGSIDINDIWNTIFGNGKPPSLWNPGTPQPTSASGTQPPRTKSPKRQRVRLVGGSKDSEGRVEVSIKGKEKGLFSLSWICIENM